MSRRKRRTDAGSEAWRPKAAEDRPPRRPATPPRPNRLFLAVAAAMLAAWVVILAILAAVS